MSVQSLFTTTVGILCVFPVAWVLYQNNYAVSERLSVLVERFSSMFRAFSGSSSDASITDREVIWTYYAQNIETWIIWGEQGYVGYPHNQFLEILVRFGLLGIALLIVSVLTFLFGLLFLFSSKRKYDLEISLISTVFVFSYLQSMTSLSLQMNRAMWLGLGYLLGIFFNQAYKVPKFMRLAPENSTVLNEDFARINQIK